MASASFRDSMNSLGWSRRDADLPANTSRQGGFLSSLQSINPFGDRGYVQLPTTEGPGAPLPAPSRREEEDAWFACESTRLLPLLPSHLPRRRPPRPVSLLGFPRQKVLAAPLQTDMRCTTCAGSAWPCLSLPPPPSRPRDPYAIIAICHGYLWQKPVSERWFTLTGET